MNYKEFLNYVKENSVCELENPEFYQAKINHVIKNNSVELDGITIHKNGENLSPTIYLNHYYEEYLNGRSLESILEEISSLLSQTKPDLDLPEKLLENYEDVKMNIVLRLVNFEKNRTLLESAPYVPFCDLAITFRWLVHYDEEGIASAMITNRELSEWNISLGELFNQALTNTKKRFPALLSPMSKIINEIAFESDNPFIFNSVQQNDLQLFVLTNSIKINGATSMIFNDVLEKFAEKQGCDIYILPSSVHEVILLPDKYDNNEAALLELVQEVNRNIVSETDFLSDSIYRYDKKENKIVYIQN